MADKNTQNPVDLVRFSVLAHVAEWLDEQGASDLTQVQDEYILRQMAKYNCFSHKEVLDARDDLARKLGIFERLPPRKPNV